MKPTAQLLRTSIICLLLLCTTFPILASNTLYYSLGGELWPSPETGGHGIALISWENRSLFKKGIFRITFNSDTLRAELYQIRSNKWEAGISLEGEYRLAALLSDYYQQGEKISSRSFYASYFDMVAYLIYLFDYKNNLRISFSRKQWLFSRKDNTEVNFVMPEDTTVATVGISYTHWQLANDPSFREPHRLFQRSTGAAFGFLSEISMRTKINQWGAQQSGSFIDNRNDPASISLLLQQWLRLSTQLNPKIKCSIFEYAGIIWGGDDINRFRIGGLNPYVTPIAGTPWAAFLSDQFISLRTQVEYEIFKKSRIGIFFDASFLKDINRTGDKSWGSATGVGILIDVRWGTKQLDLRAGYALPADWQKESPHIAFFLSLGNKISL